MSEDEQKMQRLEAVVAKLEAYERQQAEWLKSAIALLKAPPASRPAPAASSSGAPTTFPNYGRAKGQPIAGATEQDLIFYKSGALRSLSDPDKSRFHAKEQALLDAINAELGVESSGGPPPPGDNDAPPPADDGAPF